MRRGPTLLGHERDAVAALQGGSVGGREVDGHEHERLIPLRNTGHLDFEDLGDDPVSDVADVGGALGHPSAQCP